MDEDELIPKEFWPALDLHPDCLVLRAAIADRMRELGDEVGADCMQWSAEKRRSPHSEGGAWVSPKHRGEDQAKIPWELLRLSGSIPLYLLTVTEPGSEDFRRLVWRWKQCTPEQRERCWEWGPERD